MKLIPVGEERLDDLLEVYRQCEDFLALGPVAQASAEMVRADLDLSRREGGIFYGIFSDEGSLAGVLDYIPAGFAGDPETAFIELLMVAHSYRNQGLGQAVMAEIEQKIWQDPHIREILLGVQVNNPPALNFWEKQGYRVCSGPQDNPDGTTCYTMKKTRAYLGEI